MLMHSSEGELYHGLVTILYERLSEVGPGRYGGAYQYVQWANGTSILDFYSDPAISGWYQTNVRTIVTRVNSITGIKYSDDPAIFAWELINEPGVPGDDTGSILTVKPRPSCCPAQTQELCPRRPSHCCPGCCRIG